jgi:hypothetical protein
MSQDGGPAGDNSRFLDGTKKDEDRDDECARPEAEPRL